MRGRGADGWSAAGGLSLLVGEVVGTTLLQKCVCWIWYEDDLFGMKLVKRIYCTILYLPSVRNLLYQIADEVLRPDFKMSLEAAAVKSAERHKMP